MFWTLVFHFLRFKVCEILLGINQIISDLVIRTKSFHLKQATQAVEEVVAFFVRSLNFPSSMFHWLKNLFGSVSWIFFINFSFRRIFSIVYGFPFSFSTCKKEISQVEVSKFQLVCMSNRSTHYLPTKQLNPWLWLQVFARKMVKYFLLDP